MPFNPFSASSWTSLGNTIASGSQQAITETTRVVNTIVNETPKAINVAGKAITDATGKITADGVAFSNQAVNDVKNVSTKTWDMTAQQAQDRVDAIKNTMAGKVTAEQLVQIEAGIKLATKASQNQFGSFVWQAKTQITRSADICAEWCVANQCRIGVSAAIGTLGAASIASKASTTKMTPLSALSILCVAAKREVGKAAVVGTCDLTAKLMVEMIWLSPDVRRSVGEANKQILQDAIAFTLAKTLLTSAGALIVPESAEAVMWGILATLLADIICGGVVPTGAREWATVGAQGFY